MVYVCFSNISRICVCRKPLSDFQPISGFWCPKLASPNISCPTFCRRTPSATWRSTPQARCWSACPLRAVPSMSSASHRATPRMLKGKLMCCLKQEYKVHVRPTQDYSSMYQTTPDPLIILTLTHIHRLAYYQHQHSTHCYYVFTHIPNTLVHLYLHPYPTHCYKCAYAHIRRLYLPTPPNIHPLVPPIPTHFTEHTPIQQQWRQEQASAGGATPVQAQPRHDQCHYTGTSPSRRGEGG